jgi:hypothetical protein
MVTLEDTHITEEQKREKTSKKRLKNKFLYVSSDSRGTHAIQSYIDAVADKPSILTIMSGVFERDLLKFAYNKHGTHVLIKFIKLCEIHPFLESVYEIIVLNLSDLS